MTLRRLSGLAALIFAFVVPATRAVAWDSETRDRQHNLNAQPGHYAPQFYPGDARKWILEVAKDRIGDLEVGGPSDLGVNTLYQCPADFDTTQDFTSCSIGNGYDLGAARWGWLNIRKAADSAEKSEHFLIAREAARQAGLLSTAIFRPFFVRYQTPNARVASPTLLVKNGGPYLRAIESKLVVGQSWIPTPLGAGKAHAVREVSLLELTQLPDWSNSVADWAAGNELCPFTDMNGAFDATHSSVEACHRFELAMGALNVTHFAPLNRQMWKHYHRLAKLRMAECENLAPLKSQFYGDRYNLAGQTLRSNEPRVSADDTEVHECEREAMVYEMFAQHFMQDAWATGHMWKRWGQPTLSGFPDNFTLLNSTGPDYGADEVAPRRATIALLVAALGGTVHGAKPVIIEQLKGALGDYAYLALNPLVTDDPLNAPSYDIYNSFSGPPIVHKKVQWLDSLGQPHPGAGDFFWKPETHPQGAVSYSEGFSKQRETLILCTAASMYDAYRTSGGDDTNRAHGAGNHELWPLGFQQTLDNLNDDSVNNPCWDHWASNESMRAALGIDVVYQNDAISLSGLTFIANWLVLDNRAAQVGFVKDDGPPAAVHSRNVFLDRLRIRMITDMENIRESYVGNFKDNPNGTKSARGLDSLNQPLSLINTFPIADPDPGTEITDLIPYVDQYLPQTPGDTDPALPDTELNSAVSRMFWRGNIMRTCQEGPGTDGSQLYGLRARCIAAAPNGGSDADACTACVNLAEMLIPYCSSYKHLGPSKCSSIGAGSVSGLPGWWYDAEGRWDGKMGPDLPRISADSCAPPHTVALDWCTGTQEGSNADYWVGQPQSFLCDTDPILGPTYVSYGTLGHRVAKVLAETSYQTGTWIPQMVVATEQTTTTFAGADPCDYSTRLDEEHSYDYILKGSHVVSGNHLQLLPLAGGLGAFLKERNEGRQAFPEYPRCGTIQRSFGVNRSCAEAAGALGMSLSPNPHDPLAIQSINGNANGGNETCSFNMKREFMICPYGFSCAAGGECVSGRSEPTVVLISPRKAAPVGP